MLHQARTAAGSQRVSNSLESGSRTTSQSTSVLLGTPNSHSYPIPKPHHPTISGALMEPKEERNDSNCIDTAADHHLYHHLCRHEPGDSSSHRENPSSRHRDRGRSLSAAVPCKTRPEIIRNQLRTVELTNNPYIGLDTALQPPWDWLRSIFLYNERSL